MIYNLPYILELIGYANSTLRTVGKLRRNYNYATTGVAPKRKRKRIYKKFNKSKTEYCSDPKRYKKMMKKKK